MTTFQSVRSEETLSLGSITPTSSLCTASYNDTELAENVDLMYALITEKAPELPLRQELLSLGVECVYKARGVAWSGVRKKKIYLNKELERIRSDKFYEIYFSLKSSMKSCVTSDDFIIDDLNTMNVDQMKGLSYEEYVKYMNKCRSKKRRRFIELENALSAQGGQMMICSNKKKYLSSPHHRISVPNGVTFTEPEQNSSLSATKSMKRGNQATKWFNTQEDSEIPSVASVSSCSSCEIRDDFETGFDEFASQNEVRLKDQDQSWDCEIPKRISSKEEFHKLLAYLCEESSSNDDEDTVDPNQEHTENSEDRLGAKTSVVIPSHGSVEVQNMAQLLRGYLDYYDSSILSIDVAISRSIDGLNKEELDDDDDDEIERIYTVEEDAIDEELYTTKTNTFAQTKGVIEGSVESENEDRDPIEEHRTDHVDLLEDRISVIVASNETVEIQNLIQIQSGFVDYQKSSVITIHHSFTSSFDEIESTTKDDVSSVSDPSDTVLSNGCIEDKCLDPNHDETEGRDPEIYEDSDENLVYSPSSTSLEQSLLCEHTQKHVNIEEDERQSTIQTYASFCSPVSSKEEISKRYHYFSDDNTKEEEPSEAENIVENIASSTPQHEIANGNNISNIFIEKNHANVSSTLGHQESKLSYSSNSSNCTSKKLSLRFDSRAFIEEELTRRMLDKENCEHSPDFNDVDHLDVASEFDDNLSTLYFAKKSKAELKILFDSLENKLQDVTDVDGENKDDMCDDAFGMSHDYYINTERIACSDYYKKYDNNKISGPSSDCEGSIGSWSNAHSISGLVQGMDTLIYDVNRLCYEIEGKIDVIINNAFHRNSTSTSSCISSSSSSSFLRKYNWNKQRHSMMKSSLKERNVKIDSVEEKEISPMSDLTYLD